MSKPILYTVGHSTHDADAFVCLLREHGITALADVRSQPYSRRVPHFNRESLASILSGAGIRYVFLGEELGARRNEKECYVDGQTVYRLVARPPKFREGLERLRQGVARYRVTLMCAEREPLECHRTILVCRELRDEFDIRHILADGTAESHTRTEQRLVERMGATRSLFDLHASDDEVIQCAYDARAGQVAYVLPDASDRALRR